MSLELVNTFATLGTFLVIAATAVAAIVQLRHASSSNQIAALNELRGTIDSEELRASRHFVATQLSERLQDAAFRYQILIPSARSDQNIAAIANVLAVANFYEAMGVLMKSGLVDLNLALTLWSEEATLTWNLLTPVTAIVRRGGGGNAVWENFEYLTVLSQDWLAEHVNGTYPANKRRLDVKDEWFEADKQYAASLALA